MEAVSPHEVTNLLLDWRNGDEAALARLTPLVYDELRRLAGGYLRRERAGHTLQATALVHEAYLRLIGQQHLDWQSRAHFFGVAAQVMRHVLVDQARSRRAAKRGGGEVLLPLDEAADERKSRVVELRYFGGLTEEETAEVLGVSPATVRRESRLAEAWLCREVRKA
jgi:RNA polymerase sigma-70 factor, ECF subfamily